MKQEDSEFYQIETPLKALAEKIQFKKRTLVVHLSPRNGSLAGARKITLKGKSMLEDPKASNDNNDDNYNNNSDNNAVTYCTFSTIRIFEWIYISHVLWNGRMGLDSRSRLHSRRYISANRESPMELSGCACGAGQRRSSRRCSLKSVSRFRSVVMFFKRCDIRLKRGLVAANYQY